MLEPAPPTVKHVLIHVTPPRLYAAFVRFSLEKTRSMVCSLCRLIVRAMYHRLLAS
jgi:hypothetical protein